MAYAHEDSGLTVANLVDDNATLAKIPTGVCCYLPFLKFLFLLWYHVNLFLEIIGRKTPICFITYSFCMFLVEPGKLGKLLP